MNVVLGVPCPRLVLVLLGTLTTLAALGWTGVPAPTGIDGVHDDAGADARLLRSAMDGLFSSFPFLAVPVLVLLAPLALLEAPRAAIGAARALAPRGPPGS